MRELVSFIDEEPYPGPDESDPLDDFRNVYVQVGRNLSKSLVTTYAGLRDTYAGLREMIEKLAKLYPGSDVYIFGVDTSSSRKHLPFKSAQLPKPQFADLGRNWPRPRLRYNQRTSPVQHRAWKHSRR